MAGLGLPPGRQCRKGARPSMFQAAPVRGTRAAKMMSIPYGHAVAKSIPAPTNGLGIGVGMRIGAGQPKGLPCLAGAILAWLGSRRRGATQALPRSSRQHPQSPRWRAAVLPRQERLTVANSCHAGCSQMASPKTVHMQYIVLFSQRTVRLPASHEGRGKSASLRKKRRPRSGIRRLCIPHRQLCCPSSRMPPYVDRLRSSA